MENRCYCCGSKGHISTKCPQKDTKPRKDWAINKVAGKQVQHLITTPAPAPPSSASVPPTPGTAFQSEGTATEDSVFDFMGVQLEQPTLQLSQFRDLLKDQILIDSASSAHVFCNPDLVNMHTIRMEKQGLTLETNGGDFANSCTAESPYSPERVWYNPNSVANILSLALLVKHFRVTFDSQIENAFVVHTPKGNYKFTWMVGNIYALAPTKSMSHAMAHLQASFHQG
jgi:hypothetical protein